MRALLSDISRRAVLGYGLAVALLGWVLATANLGETFALLAEFPIPVMIAVLAISAIGLVPQVWMWMALMESFENARFIDLLQADLVIKFVNNLFPSRFSGRSMAPLAIRHFTGSEWASATAATGAHTGLYATCYSVASIIGVLLLAPRLGFGILLVIVLSTAIYVMVAVTIISVGWHLERFEPLLHSVGSWLERLPLVGSRVRDAITGITGVIGDSADRFRSLLRQWTVVAGFGGAWVLALMVFPGIRVFLLFSGLGVPPHDPWLLPFYLIPAYAITILPLTPGGIGVAEATSTLVFVAIGYPTHVVVPVIVLDRFLGIYLPALAGWYPTTTIDFGAYIPKSG